MSASALRSSRWSSSTRCRGAWVTFGCIAALLMHSQHAHAAHCDGGAYPETEIHPPGLVEFSAKGVEVGQGLSPWIATNGGGRTAEFHCTADVPISYRIEGHGGYVARYSESGEEYLVYPTGVAGVGVVIGVVYFRSVGSRPKPAGYYEHEAYSGASGIGYIGATFFIKYVRTGDIVNGSAATSREMVIEARLYESGSGSPLRKQVYIMPTTLKIQDRPSCRVRPQNVDMGRIFVGSFKGVGTTAGERRYEVALDCEAGVGQVNFQAAPTTPVLDTEQGLAEASGGVQGVGYQFLLGDGSPMRFYATHEFGYGAAGASVLSKTFGVRYRQVSPTILPGHANAGLTYTLILP